MCELERDICENLIYSDAVKKKIIFIFSAPSSSNNTGTIVAVVFVILLLLILAAFLVFYLRTKQKAKASIQASSVSHISCAGFGNELYDAVSFLAVHVFVLCKSFNLKGIVHQQNSNSDIIYYASLFLLLNTT